MSLQPKHLLLVGAGPGLGRAIAARFGAAGYAVSLIARDERKLADLATDLTQTPVRTYAADIADTAALQAAVQTSGREHSRVDVLAYNPSFFREADALHTSAADLSRDLTIGAGGLLTAVQAAREYLQAGSRIIATGSAAADQPWEGAVTLGVQKAALRNLIVSLDKLLSPEHIRATTLTINGVLGSGPTFEPDPIAEAYFAAAHQERDWQREVSYPSE